MYKDPRAQQNQCKYVYSIGVEIIVYHSLVAFSCQLKCNDWRSSCQSEGCHLQKGVPLESLRWTWVVRFIGTSHESSGLLSQERHLAWHPKPISLCVIYVPRWPGLWKAQRIDPTVESPLPSGNQSCSSFWSSSETHHVCPTFMSRAWSLNNITINTLKKNTIVW